jgi:hypothetical protein
MDENSEPVSSPPVNPEPMSFEPVIKKPSKLWYLVPIIFGPLGGLVGYFLVKNKDRNFAEWLLIIGIAMVAVYGAISLVFALSGTIWIASFEETQTKAVDAIAQAQLKCAGLVISVKEANYPAASSVGNLDVLVSYDVGSETLSELRVEAASGDVRVSSPIVSQLSPGQKKQVTVFNATLPPDFVRAIAVCENAYPVVSAECRLGQSCMKPI